ncbi:MAG: SiM protein, partial [Streptococcus parauberis]
MAKKIKARKHALRKAVTATVLASTALGTMGGAVGTVRTVKADEFRSSLNKGKDYDSLINVATSVQNHDPNALNQLREVLKNFSTESLHSLLLGLDNAHLQYKHSQLTSFSNIIGTFNNDNKKDFYHKNLNLVSLLIQELRSRIISNENRGKLLEEKEVTIKEKQQELDKTKKGLQDLFESKLKMAKREAKHSEDLNNKIEDLNKKLASEKKKYEIATRDAANLFIQRESIQKEADKYKNEAKVMTHALEQAK